MRCPSCEGEGKVEAVRHCPEFGRIECDHCEGEGAVCESCEMSLKGNRFYIAGPDLCTDCGEETTAVLPPMEACS
jgi:RecJ-like exonuclease